MRRYFGERFQAGDKEKNTGEKRGKDQKKREGGSLGFRKKERQGEKRMRDRDIFEGLSF